MMPDDRPLIERFAEQAERHPDRTAVLSGTQACSYAGLAARAGGVAAALRAAGAGPGTRVALLLDHGLPTIAGILGTLWTGAAYVPLDPSYPRQRLATTLQDADAVAVVTDAGNRTLLAALTGTARAVVDLADTVPGHPPMTGAPADDPAYVLYTSGSTGRPKGVVQAQRSVAFQVRNHTTRLRITPDDRHSVLTSFAFDMAVTDLFSALLNAAAAVPVDLLGAGLDRLRAALLTSGVTLYHSTPTVFRHLLDALDPGTVLPDLRAVLLGGEPVTWQDVARAGAHLRPGSVLVNGYGATEISFIAQNHLTLPHPDAAGRSGVVPVGAALDGVSVELLDPTGHTGEIAVRSRCVALGYWRDEEGTAAKFRRHDDGTRTYRTGDLGRRLPDGTLEYLGRTDRQVKIRGNRVEPGEVEAALRAQPGVRTAAVTTYAGPAGTALAAFVVAAPGAAPDVGLLRGALADTLPAFLVPAVIRLVAELPMTPTGKVDLAALPPVRDPGSGADDPPRGPEEAVVAAAWCAALGLAAVGRGEDFFEAGGDSLLLVDVQRRLEAELGRRVPLAALLAAPTVAASAALLWREEAQDADAGVRDRMARRRRARERRTG